MTSLRRYLWALTLFPSLLVAALACIVYGHQQLENTREQLRFEANIISAWWAPQLSAQIHQNHTNWQALLAPLTKQEAIRSVALRNRQGKILAQIGPSLPILDTTELVIGVQHFMDNHPFRLLTPIALPFSSQSDEQLPCWLDIEMSKAPLTITRYQVAMVCLLIFLGSVIFGIVMAWYLTRITLNPLQLLRRSLLPIIQGNTVPFTTSSSSSPSSSTQTPIASLAIAPMSIANLRFKEHQTLMIEFSQMLQGLNQVYQDLQDHANQANQDLRQTLETIEIQNIELDIARKEALQSSQIKSEFLANMSHEIRTPLNGVIGFSKLLMKTTVDARQHEYLSTILKCSESLLTIVNDILDFSKIESGKLVLEQVAFNLCDLVEEVLTMLSPPAHEKALELVQIFYIDDQIIYKGDPLRIKQVLTNLVNNAIKFTEKGSVSIRVTCEGRSHRGDLIKITVTDTGIGLPQHHERLFVPFSQGDASSARHHGGTGLGLAISKHLIESMQGEIGFQSEPQQGTTFWFSLPLPQNPERQANAPPETLRGRSILICDDAPLTRLSLKKMLQPLQIQITELNHLDRLLPTIESIYSHAKILDAIVIGGQDLPQQGSNIINTLNHIEKEYGIRCLLMANTQELHYWQAYEGLDIAHCIAKPITRSRLLHALATLILDEANPISLPFQPHTLLPYHPSLPSHHLLCVDDNLTNLRLLETMLLEMGLQVTTATSGGNALALVKELQATLDGILMDIHMPHIDGIAATAQLHSFYQQHQQPSPPIIAVTAHALLSEQQMLLAQGFDDILIKPIQEAELAALLHRLGIRTRLRQASNPYHARYNPTQSQREATVQHQLTQVLIDSLEQTRRDIKTTWEADDLFQLQEIIHKLHGAVCYCDLPQLKAAVQHLENLLKKGVSLGLPQAVKAVCTQIEGLLTQQTEN
jgi:two-component system sensor histidine kinase BarA